MKAEIDEYGTLQLQADNPTEAFTLKKWFGFHESIRTKGIINISDIRLKEYKEGEFKCLKKMEKVHQKRQQVQEMVVEKVKDEETVLV